VGPRVHPAPRSRPVAPRLVRPGPRAGARAPGGRAPARGARARRRTRARVRLGAGVGRSSGRRVIGGRPSLSRP
jgi:hypothetical protein